jgi:gluconolactonase
MGIGWCQEKDGKETVIASEYEGKRLNSPNDVVVRRDGQVLRSCVRCGSRSARAFIQWLVPCNLAERGHFDREDATSQRSGAHSGWTTLYMSDSQEKTIDAYDLDKYGNASRERTFISGIDGTPDGLRVAESGNLHIACRGIAIYTPDAKPVKMIEFPETSVNCAFGGPDLQALYVAVRSSAYRVRVGFIAIRG